MDGKFVDSKSVDLNDLKFIKDLKNDFEVHLMCKNPFSYFDLCEELGLKKVFFHFEIFSSIENLNIVIMDCVDRNFEIGIVLNPETNFDDTIPLIGSIDNIMFMSVKPGAEGQGFIEKTYEKIRICRILNPKINIVVDGGIKENEIKKLFLAGANIFCVGSFLSSAKDPKKNYLSLKESISPKNRIKMKNK